MKTVKIPALKELRTAFADIFNKTFDLPTKFLYTKYTYQTLFLRNYSLYFKKIFIKDITSLWNTARYCFGWLIWLPPNIVHRYSKMRYLNINKRKVFPWRSRQNIRINMFQRLLLRIVYYIHHQNQPYLFLNDSSPFTLVSIVHHTGGRFWCVNTLLRCHNVQATHNHSLSVKKTLLNLSSALHE